MAKHGEAREQYMNSPQPRTVTVINDEFDGNIMTINEEQYNAKTMKRCNDHGQLVDERGRVMLESIPKSQMAPPKADAAKDEKKQ